MGNVGLFLLTGVLLALAMIWLLRLNVPVPMKDGTTDIVHYVELEKEGERLDWLTKN